MTERQFPSRALYLLLIAAGVVLLLSNVGWLHLDIWSLLRLWPLLLVAAGVDVLLHGRYRLLLTLGTLAVAAVLYVGGSSLLGGASALPERLAQSLQGAARADLHLRVGVSELRLDASASRGQLLEGTVQAAQGERIARTFHEAGGTAFYTLSSERPGGFVSSRGRRVWNLSVSPLVPLSLMVETGVGRAHFDLTKAKLARLKVSMGVGEATVLLPAGDYHATLDGGVGALTVQLPRGLPVQLEVSRGVGALTVRGHFTQEDDVYTTPGYAATDARAHLRVHGGVGPVTIEQPE